MTMQVWRVSGKTSRWEIQKTSQMREASEASQVSASEASQVSASEASQMKTPKRRPVLINKYILSLYGTSDPLPTPDSRLS